MEHKNINKGPRKHVILYTAVKMSRMKEGKHTNNNRRACTFERLHYHEKGTMRHQTDPGCPAEPIVRSSFKTTFFSSTSQRCECFENIVRAKLLSHKMLPFNSQKQ